MIQQKSRVYRLLSSARDDVWKRQCSAAVCNDMTSNGRPIFA